MTQFAGSCQVNLLKPGCLDDSLTIPVILFVIIAAAVIVLALFLLFKGLQNYSGETLRELQHDPVRKPVNANLGLIDNRIIYFSYLQMFLLLCLVHTVVFI